VESNQKMNKIELAKQWLINAMKFIKTPAKKGTDKEYLDILRDRSKNAKRKLIGQVLLFRYRPENKVKFYDKYPLVLITSFTKSGFVGVNLHYIPPKDRLRLILLMNSLVLNVSEKDRQKIRIRIFSLINKKIFTKYKSTVMNAYIGKNIVGKPKITTPEEWTMFAFLPVFKGINPSKLYSEILKETKKYA